MTPNPNVRYLGHLPGGNPVQAHSAGEHYPFVIAAVENGAGSRWYEVTGPGTPRLRFEQHGDAYVAARRLALLGLHEDAWAFEIEQACTCAGMKLFNVQASLRKYCAQALGGRHKFAELTPPERVAAIHYVGAVRRQANNRLPLGVRSSAPLFSVWVATAAARANQN